MRPTVLATFPDHHSRSRLFPVNILERLLHISLHAFPYPVNYWGINQYTVTQNVCVALTGNWPSLPFFLMFFPPNRFPLRKK